MYDSAYLMMACRKDIFTIFRQPIYDYSIIGTSGLRIFGRPWRFGHLSWYEFLEFTFNGEFLIFDLVIFSKYVARSLFTGYTY